MTGKSSSKNRRTSGVAGVTLKHPTAATGNRWQVEIRKTNGARGCYDALNTSFPAKQQETAETYARRMMRIFGTDHLERVA